jgi:uncharacterized membrane protein
METLLILYLVSGGFLILISLPLLAEKIKPNSLYGFRVSQTLDDPKIWYATNKYAARWLIAAGVSIVLAAALLYQVPDITVDAYALGCLAVFAIVMTIGIVQSIRYMRRLG